MERGELAEIRRACRDPGAGPGDAVRRWERAVADYVGVPYAAAVSSGRVGMTLILKRLGVGPGDEVIIPAYTLGELIPLIEGLGARATPADIDERTLNISPEAVRRRLNARTRAVLALHAFGTPCEIEEITRMAGGRGVAVVEDCAHSLGASVGRKRTGSFGDAAFFSFETIKPVNTWGGGMVVSRDSGLIESVREATSGDVVDAGPLRKKARAIAMERLMFATGLAFPPLWLLAQPRCARLMNRLYRRFQRATPGGVRYLPVQAEIGLRKLPRLDERIADRERKARLFRSLLKPGIQAQIVPSNCHTTLFFFVATLPHEAAEVRRKLLLRGIDAGVGEEIADDCAAAIGYDDCPNARRVFSRAIALPFYDGIPDSVINRVARTLNSLVRHPTDY